MGVDVAIRYIEEINPDHILFIEPGTKDFFGKMLEIREWLLKKNFNVLYPCPKPLACPMKGTEDWCHQFIHVKQDQEVERISQMARKDRKLLPLTVQAFSKTYTATNPHERLVRVLPETKFSFEWEVCHDNQLEHYQVMKRDMSKSEVKEIGNIMAGEGIVTEIIKNVDRTKRVKLIKVIKL
jgi:ribosomal protein RSM22 (predicted rRNA methylase)